MRFQQGAEVHDYNSADYFKPDQLIWLDRFAQFALIAANETVKTARLKKEEIV